MASTAHIGKTRALVFPVMSNGYLQLDYSEYNDGDYKHNLWGHKNESFTLEAIITPYDCNGQGHRATGYGRLDSTKTPPSPNMSLDDHANTTSAYQSISYFGAERNTHKMMLFYNPYFQFYLENVTSSNFNQPAEYKLVCKIIQSTSSGSSTHTIESDKIITASNRLKGYYDPDGFYENGKLITNKSKISSSATAAMPTGSIQITGNLNTFTNTAAVPITLGNATINVNTQPTTSNGSLDTTTSAGIAATGSITFDSGWSQSSAQINPEDTASDNNAIILRNRDTTENKTYRFFYIDESSGEWPSGMRTGDNGTIIANNYSGGADIKDALESAGYDLIYDIFVKSSQSHAREQLNNAINIWRTGTNGLGILASTGNIAGVAGTITLTQGVTGAAGNHSTTPNTGPVIGSVVDDEEDLTASVFTGGVDAITGTNINEYITISMGNVDGSSLITKKFKFYSGTFSAGTTTTTADGTTVQKVSVGGNTTATASHLVNAINSSNGFGSGTASHSGNTVTISSPNTHASNNQTNQTLSRTSAQYQEDNIISFGSNPFDNFNVGSSAITPTAYITLTDTNGNVIRYKPSKGDNSETTGSTGTENGGVTYFINSTSSTSTTATNLRTAITGNNGHGQYSPAMSASLTTNTITLSATATNGSHDIASTGISSGLSLTDFTGGAGNTLSVSSGETNGLGAGNQIFDNAGVLIGNVSTISGVNITLTAAPITPVTSTIYTSQKKEALYIEQMNKVSCSFDKGSVSIYLNNILVARKKVYINNFEFKDADCCIGQNGSNTNTQFMGELYEISMHKGSSPCTTISTLTPNYGDTLFYYTFGD